MVKMTAHSGDASSLDWHPILPAVVATGGASGAYVCVCCADGNHITSMSGATTSCLQRDSQRLYFVSWLYHSTLGHLQTGALKSGIWIVTCLSTRMIATWHTTRIPSPRKARTDPTKPIGPR